MGRPFPCPKCGASNWRLEYYESAYQTAEVELGENGKPVIVDCPAGDDYGNYDSPGLDEALRCRNCDTTIDLADVRELPLGRYEALVAALRRLCQAFDMSDHDHADFANSGADVVEALWTGNDPRGLLEEIEKEEKPCQTIG